jgi:hypothetical protein
MSQKHPRRRMVDGQVLDAVDFNEALRPFVEVSLNEQNLSTRLKAQLSRGEDLEAGALVESGSAGDAGGDVAGATPVIDALAADYTDISTSPGFLAGDPRQRFYEADTWIKIPATEKTFVTEGGALTASFFLQCNEEIGPESGDVTNKLAHCVRFGIFLDGGLIFESVLGGQDPSAEAANMDQGRHIPFHSVSREIQVPVAAGAHTLHAAFFIVPLYGLNLWDSTSTTGEPLLTITQNYLDYYVEHR